MALSPETLAAAEKLVASSPPMTQAQFETIASALFAGKPLHNKESQNVNEAS
ncbi:hypothetical protein [Rhodococcus sp. MS16]|uniref:hypothetical protein n=1 Tax=Rhodococcus sp. MS16 TaxID=2579941 RepID=UPI00156270BE|nr:hypothetical protein [Rhodococcus sp. MS16]